MNEGVSVTPCALPLRDAPRQAGARGRSEDDGERRKREQSRVAA